MGRDVPAVARIRSNRPSSQGLKRDYRPSNGPHDALVLSVSPVPETEFLPAALIPFVIHHGDVSARRNGPAGDPPLRNERLKTE